MAASNDHRLAAMVELRARGKLPPELEKQIPAVAMARLSPGMRARAQAMLEGRSLISAREKSTKWGQQLLETTNLIDPAYDEAAAVSRFKTVKDFADVSPGKPGAMMAAAGTAIKHMKRLESLIPGVAGHQIPVIGKAVNATENTLADWSGAPGITRWNQTADTAASELTRYFRQAGGNEADIQRELHSFTPNASDEQKHAAIEGMGHLLGARLQEMVSQYQQGTAMHRMPPSMSPEATSMYKKFTGEDISPVAHPSPGPEAKAGSGNSSPGKLTPGKDGVRVWSPN